MGILSFFGNPARSLLLTLVEQVFNFADSTGLHKIAELTGNDFTPYKSKIQKAKKMIKTLTLNVDEKNSILHAKLQLAGEQTELEVSIHYKKKQVNGVTAIQLVKLETSKEWINILIMDILIGEGLIDKSNLRFKKEGIPGKLLNSIL